MCLKLMIAEDNLLLKTIRKQQKIELMLAEANLGCQKEMVERDKDSDFLWENLMIA
jgi:hypothetical protein